MNTALEVRAKGGIVHDAIAIFTYQLPSSIQNFKNEKLSLSSLTDFTTLIKTAVNENYIKTNEEAAVMKWKEKPEQWPP